MPAELIAQSTRLFPKGQGADACRPTGIAARCDWIVMSDVAAPQTHLIRRRAVPQHIFLSLREPFAALRFFAQEVLPQLSRPFVLISGSEDVTLPDQTDTRWRGFDAAEAAMLRAIHDHPLVLRWFAENLSRGDWPKMRPLPLGLVLPEGEAPVPVPQVPPLDARPLRVLCAHRIRASAQWEPRRKVGALARGPWRDWTTVLDRPLTEPDFMAEVAAHAFVLCVEGGGLDPAPKAWHALLGGAIPIVRSTALDPAYDALPVARVADWTADAVTPARLDRWRRDLGPRMAARGDLLARLGIDFWWDRICADGL